MNTVTLFPDGLRSAGQSVFVLAAGEEPVGSLWLGIPKSDEEPDLAWVYDIEVREAFRGRGYGRQAMLLAEQEARSRGMRVLGLNVFGANAVARGLYDSLGFKVTSQQMKKDL